MADESHPQSLEPRLPTEADFLFLCSALNREGVQYIVIGGWALIQLGFGRTTSDIDLLVEGSDDNIGRLRAAMLTLPDGAIRELEPGDLNRYVVVRVNDAFTVDLMLKACGVDYSEAQGAVEFREIKGIPVSFANARLMLRLKQTHRDKDALDRAFLERLLKDSDDSTP